MLTDVEVLGDRELSESETEDSAFRLYDSLIVRTGRFGNDLDSDKVLD